MNTRQMTSAGHKIRLKSHASFYLVLLPLLFFLVACQEEPAAGPPTSPTLSSGPSPAASRPRPTATPVPTATSTPTATASPSPTARPTSTPTPTLEPPPTPVLTPTEVAPLHFQHLPTSLPPEEILAQMEEWEFLAPAADELSVDALLTTSPPETQSRLTLREAEKDVQFLFNVLKHGYAGYGFFNDDNRFELARSQLLEGLRARNQGHITAESLAAQIYQRLSFIRDCHMAIGGYRFLQHSDFWYWEEIDFFRQGERFWFLDQGEPVWVETVNGQPPAGFMKRSLNEAGDPVYYLGVLAQTRPSDFTLTTTNPDGSQGAISGQWRTSTFSVAEQEAFARDETESGIPVVISRRFWGDEEALTEFVADAERLRDEPIIMVDIRGNIGGNDYWPSMWLTNLLDSDPSSVLAFGELRTRTALVSKLNWLENDPTMEAYLRSMQSQLNELEAGEAERGWVNRVPDASAPLSREQLIVVLMDRHVASSAENFIALLATVENVVFVGTNSGGCIHYGELGHHYLPNSGLRVQFGTKLFMLPSMQFIEGTGFWPDLWLPADRARQRAVAAIEKGWLQPIPARP